MSIQQTKPPCEMQGFKIANLIAQERGQTTTEYGLVLLAAATIAMLVVTWAGGTGAIGNLFDAIMAKVITMAG